MNYDQDKFEEFRSLLEKYAPQEGMQPTGVRALYTFRISTPYHKKPEVYEPAIVIGGQGQKYCYVGNRQYDYNPGNFLALFLPMPIEIEVLEASPDKPFLAAAIGIKVSRLANLVLKMDQIESDAARPAPNSASGIFSAPLTDSLLDPVLRLLKSLGDPSDAAILGDTIVDEIYYRILRNEQGGVLKSLLQQRGQIQRIARAVEHIHQHLDEVVSVEQLADLVNMSSSRFHKNFQRSDACVAIAICQIDEAVQGTNAYYGGKKR